MVTGDHARGAGGGWRRTMVALSTDGFVHRNERCSEKTVDD